MGLFRRKNSENSLVSMQSLLANSFRNVQKDTAYILSWLNHLHQKHNYQEQLINQLQTRHNMQDKTISQLQSKHQLQEDLINQINNKNRQQESLIKQLKEELNYMPKSKEDIRKIVDEFYSYEHLLNRIKELGERIEDLRKSHLDLHKSHSDLHQKHHEIGPKIEAKLESLRSELKHEIEAKPIKITTPSLEIGRLQERLEKLESRKSTIKEKIIKQITKNSKDYVKSIILSYIKKYGKITALQLKEMVVEEQGLCSKSSFYRLLEEIEEEPEIALIKEGKEKHYMAKMSKKNY